ncbi:MAG: hypothetical protein U0414_36585 [Polyangiaceae bacterium]
MHGAEPVWRLMRWFVDISLIGSGGKASRFCVEAEQWQRALQTVRERRKDASPFANFSIELLEDGYRAIDPATRTRYVVQKAPEDAALTDQPVEIQGNPSVPPPPPAKEKGGRARRRGAAPIPNDPVPAQAAAPKKDAAPEPAPRVDPPAAPAAAAPAPEPEPAKAAPAAVPAPAAPPAPAPAPAPPRPAAPNRAPTPAPIARPMQAETAFEKMTQGLSFPLAGNPAAAEVTTQILPPFKILTERTQLPNDTSPIHYKEVALAVESGTSERDAEAILRAQFELIRASLRDAPAGQFIQLAVFDHAFQGRPLRPPMVTLSFKDWRDKEPAISFTGSMSLPPPVPDTQVNPDPGVPPAARRSEPKSEPPPHEAPKRDYPAPQPSGLRLDAPARTEPAKAPPNVIPDPPPSAPPSRRAPPPSPSSIRRAASSMDEDVTAVKLEPAEKVDAPPARAAEPASEPPASKPPASKPPKPPPPRGAATVVADKTAPMTAFAIPSAPESVTTVGSPPTLPSEIGDSVDFESAPVAERRGANVSVESPPPVEASAGAPPAIPLLEDEKPYDATARITGAPIVSIGAAPEATAPPVAESERMAPTVLNRSPRRSPPRHPSRPRRPRSPSPSRLRPPNPRPPSRPRNPPRSPRIRPPLRSRIRPPRPTWRPHRSRG